MQAAARGFISLLRFSILACRQRPKKKFKGYSKVNPNLTPFARIGPGTGPAGLPDWSRYGDTHPFISRAGFLKFSCVCIENQSTVATVASVSECILLNSYTEGQCSCVTCVGVLVSLGHSGSLRGICLIDEVGSDFWFRQINSDNTNRIN